MWAAGEMVRDPGATGAAKASRLPCPDDQRTCDRLAVPAARASFARDQIVRHLEEGDADLPLGIVDYTSLDT